MCETLSSFTQEWCFIWGTKVPKPLRRGELELETGQQLSNFNCKLQQEMDSGAGEMAQGLRALAALPEDLSLIPSTHMAASKLSATPVPENPTPSSGLLEYKEHHTSKHTYI